MTQEKPTPKQPEAPSTPEAQNDTQALQPTNTKAEAEKRVKAGLVTEPHDVWRIPTNVRPE
jgi:hypothetical protein